MYLKVKGFQIPGETKRKYNGEIIRFNKSLKIPLNCIKSVLPFNYYKYNILDLFKKLYPYEWNTIEQRYLQYKSKDDFLSKIGKKKRYYPTLPQFYLFNLQKVKHMLSEGQKKIHQQNFNEENRVKNLKVLQEKVKNRMIKINEKVNKEKEFMQEVEPLYANIYIQAYHKKGIPINEKMEIVKELEKYECEKSTEFFSKLNDSERNEQIRRIAFNHLQSIGKYVKLRKNFDGNKKQYMIEKTEFDMKPFDLLEKIEKDTIQNKKSFDYFISHSFMDNNLVMIIKKHFNQLNYHIYCDWLNDTDFLKRKYAGEFTKIVLKKRIEQSKKVLFIRTNNTHDEMNNYYSEWVQMEIEYAKELKKEIVCIDLINDGKCEFKIYPDTNQFLSELKKAL